MRSLARLRVCVSARSLTDYMTNIAGANHLAAAAAAAAAMKRIKAKCFLLILRLLINSQTR